MTIQDIIKDIMKKEGMTQNGLAKELHVTKQAVSSLLKDGDMRIYTLLSVLDVLGYEFQIKKSKPKASVGSNE